MRRGFGTRCREANQQEAVTDEQLPCRGCCSGARRWARSLRPGRDLDFSAVAAAIAGPDERRQCTAGTSRTNSVGFVACAHSLWWAYRVPVVATRSQSGRGPGQSCWGHRGGHDPGIASGSRWYQRQASRLGWTPRCSGTGVDERRRYPAGARSSLRPTSTAANTPSRPRIGMRPSSLRWEESQRNGP